MCRLLGYCARGESSLESLIGADGLSAFTGLCALHGDGWGMAWYDRAEPAIRKSPRRADGEHEYAKLVSEPLSDLGLVHLRWATPGLAVGESNCHPFRYGQYVLAHNGAIHPQDRLAEMLPPAWERQLGGTTDSERYFLSIMARLDRQPGQLPTAIAAAADDIERRFEPNSLNAILLAPDKLYAISWYNQDRVPAAKLRQAGYDRPDDIAAYFDLAYQQRADSVVVASSGWPQAGWTPLPNRHVLVVDRVTLDTVVLPLRHSAATMPSSSSSDADRSIGSA